jgi:heme/copper-type cytochrome/quinol oxidase subunit 1
MIWLGYSGMPRRVLDYPAAMGGWHSLSTSAHILTVAGILCFFVMLFDSLRKKQAYVIKTFGIGRYNTRLNFYIYEINRNKYWTHKYSFLLNNNNKFILKNTANSHSLFKIQNYETFDLTYFSYIFIKK